MYPVSKAGPSSTQPIHKALHIADLEDGDDLDFESMRDNEGEAAEHGVYFDDTSYDYMQHLRDFGGGSGESHFVDAAPVKVQGKGKAKARTMKLEDAIREATLEDEPEDFASSTSALGDDISSSIASKRPRTYQDQQDVPDEIAGFQPDMDPRLRETLEALEDDAYVDEKDENDIFGALVAPGRAQEVDLDEFENTFDDEDGWESDATQKPSEQQKQIQLGDADQAESQRDQRETAVPDAGLRGRDEEATAHPNAITDAATASAEDGDWLRDFAKFKQGQAKKVVPAVPASNGAPSAVQGGAPSLYTLNGTPLRQKRRKGAQTNPSAYSMTSSSLARTDAQQLLDARFEKFDAMYALDEEDRFDDEDGGMSLASGLSKQSKMSSLSTTSFADGDVRGDLDSMMDGFLDGWSKGHPGGGKQKGAKGKRGKNGNEVLGMRMLDEVRGELGPARIKRSQKA